MTADNTMSDDLLPVTAFDSSKITIEETRRSIDQKKVELYEMIRHLNSRRNDLAPISILPPELLGRIFTFVIAAGYRADLQEFSFTFDFSSWLNFTYVSQKWRNIALDTPSLWDTPTFLYPTWARAMLERSKMADLVVHTDASLISSPDVMKEIFDNHTSRIREINLLGLTSPFLSSVLENVPPSSFRLRSLSLSNACWTEDDNKHFPKFPADLLVKPDDLRRLDIDRCIFDWNAQPHPLLTHLSLLNIPIPNCPLLSDFVMALSGMPALELLEVRNSFPVATEAIKLGRKVELPRLGLLHLSSPQNSFEVLNIVNLLVVPWTARIELSWAVPPGGTAIRPSEIGSPLDLFFSCMTGNIEGRSYSRLRLYYSGETLVVAAWRNELQDHKNSDLPDLDLTLNLSDNESIQPLDEVLPYLPISDLQTLVLGVVLGQRYILKHFGQCTAIQKVELQFHFVLSEFLQALTHKPEGYEFIESSYYSVSFPALKSLNFDRASFPDLQLAEVLDCLMERYERGAEVQKVGISHCYGIADDDIELIREIVVDVEWDEFVQHEEYEDYTSDSVMGYFNYD